MVVTKVSGYFSHLTELEQMELNQSKDDDDDSDSEAEFLNIQDINRANKGGAVAKVKRPKLRTVKIHTHTGVELAEGRFHVDDPWFNVSFTGQKYKGQKVVRSQGSFQYSLRTDDDVSHQGILALFLNKMLHLDSALVNSFIAKMESDRVKRTFENLETYLDSVSEVAEMSHAVRVIQNEIKGNVDGVLMRLGLYHPSLIEHLPSLFPKKFHFFLQSGVQSYWPVLETAMTEEVWVFGFNTVMWKRYKIISCEATLNDYTDSGLLCRLSPLHLDALYIYHVMKRLCYQYGHTYAFLDGLMRSKMFQDHVIRNWNAALDFLVEHKVIVKESDSSRERIYLERLWKSEKFVAKGLDNLFTLQSKNPYELEVDFDSEEFKTICQDKDQKLATEMCLKSPVVVISGKGGCGKTHVVSSFIKHAEPRKTDGQTDIILSSKTVLLNAPTGKAAKLIGKRSAIHGYTLHSVTQSYKTYKEKQAANKSKEQMKVDNDEKSHRDKRMHTVHKDSPMKGKMNEKYSNNAVGTPFNDKQCQNVDESKIMNHARPTQTSGINEQSMLDDSNALNENPANDGSDHNKTEIEQWKFSHIKIWVIDECSLLSVGLFHTLFKILLEEADLRKIILLGDINQLPSIEPGNFLSDVYSAMLRVKCSVTLHTNHRSESDLIVKNATLISESAVPVFDAERRFQLYKVPESTAGGGGGGGDESSGQDTVMAIMTVLNTNKSLEDHTKSQFVAFRRIDCQLINEICCMHYNKHPLKKLNSKKLDFRPHDKICCTKNAEVKIWVKVLINDKAEKESSTATSERTPERTADIKGFNADEVLEMISRPNYWSTPSPQSAPSKSKAEHTSFKSSHCGDKVDIHNNQPKHSPRNPAVDTSFEKNEKTPPDPGPGYQWESETSKLCNGEIFFIEQMCEYQDKDKKVTWMYLWDGRETEETRFVIDEHTFRLKCKPRHAWARTIHTYQGSESNVIVYVVGNSPYQNWQHVYTAVTRGRLEVDIVSQFSQLQAAVMRLPDKRRTSLRERLDEKLKMSSGKNMTDNSSSIQTPSKSHLARYSAYDSSPSCSTIPSAIKPPTVISGVKPGSPMDTVLSGCMKPYTVTTSASNETTITRHPRDCLCIDCQDCCCIDCQDFHQLMISPPVLVSTATKSSHINNNNQTLGTCTARDHDMSLAERSNVEMRDTVSDYSSITPSPAGQCESRLSSGGGQESGVSNESGWSQIDEDFLIDAEIMASNQSFTRNINSGYKVANSSQFTQLIHSTQPQGRNNLTSSQFSDSNSGFRHQTESNVCLSDAKLIEPDFDSPIPKSGKTETTKRRLFQSHKEFMSAEKRTHIDAEHGLSQHAPLNLNQRLSMVKNDMNNSVETSPLSTQFQCSLSLTGEKD